MHRPNGDESDMYDKKAGDPDATLERDYHLAGLDHDGRQKRDDDTADRRLHRPGEVVLTPRTP